MIPSQSPHDSTLNESYPLSMQAIDRIITTLPGKIGLAVKDLSTGMCLEHNAKQRFPTASIFKVPIMVELFRQVHDSLINLDDRYRPHWGICRHGTGIIKNMPYETEFSLGDLCRLMIAQSDNIATDLILEVIGLESVNRTLDRLGFDNTRTSMPIGRWHYCMVRMDKMPINTQNDKLLETRLQAGQVDFNSLSFTDSLENNVTNAIDMAVMLERMYQGQLISDWASASMLDMLKACEHRGMIPRYLKPDIPVAHKVGQSQRIRGDVGIVFLPNHPLVISALSLAPEPGNQRPGRQAIAQISRLVVGGLCSQAVRDGQD